MRAAKNVVERLKKKKKTNKEITMKKSCDWRDFAQTKL